MHARMPELLESGTHREQTRGTGDARCHGTAGLVVGTFITGMREPALLCADVFGQECFMNGLGIEGTIRRRAP